MFRFVTFLLQYVTYIAQCVLSLFQEPKSNTYFTINASEVGCILVLLLFRTLVRLFTAPLIPLTASAMPRVGGHLPLSDHVVVAEWTDLVWLETPTHL